MAAELPSTSVARRLGRDGSSDLPQSLASHVLHQLGRLIVAGTVAPGEALPTESELATEFEVSKTVIREAVRGLIAKGLVRARTRLGTRVQPVDSWHTLDPDVLAWQLMATPDHAQLRDFEEFRRAVEPAGATLAATRATREDLAQIRAALEAMRSTVDDPARYFEADLLFHTSVLGASHNRIFRGLRDALRSALVVRHTSVGEILTDMRESLPFHEQVAAAVASGDGTAAAVAMTRLLDLTKRDESRLAGRAPGRPAGTQGRARRPRAAAKAPSDRS